MLASAALAVESANVVGFTDKTSADANNFITVPFLSVGYTTSDIQDIKLDDDGAGSIGWGTEMFSIWEGIPSVVSGSEFVYYDPANDPNGEATDYYWGDASANPVTYSITSGQGVVISMAADLGVTIKAPYTL